MIRKSVLWTLLDLVFLIAFNLIFFIVSGLTHTISVWISYTFIHISYVMLLLTPLFTHNNKTKFILGMSISAISYIYFMIDLTCGIMFIIFLSDKLIIPLIVNIVLLALYLLLLISVVLTNERTNTNLQIHEAEMKYINKASSGLENLSIMIDDKNLLKKVNKAYDIISASPVHSDESVKSIENEVLTIIDEMNEMFLTDKNNTYNLIDKIICLANKRNAILRKLNK